MQGLHLHRIARSGHQENSSSRLWLPVVRLARSATSTGHVSRRDPGPTAPSSNHPAPYLRKRAVGGRRVHRERGDLAGVLLPEGHPRLLRTLHAWRRQARAGRDGYVARVMQDRKSPRSPGADKAAAQPTKAQLTRLHAAPTSCTRTCKPLPRCSPGWWTRAGSAARPAWGSTCTTEHPSAGQALTQMPVCYRQSDTCRSAVERLRGWARPKPWAFQRRRSRPCLHCELAQISFRQS